jgi:predicted site-specific integrase-resolvase
MAAIVGGSARAEDAPLLLEIREAAHVLGVSASMVRNYVAKGMLRLAGRTRRGCRLFDLDACRALCFHLKREPQALED